jgi:hypothetical protein
MNTVSGIMLNLDVAIKKALTASVDELHTLAHDVSTAVEDPFADPALISTLQSVHLVASKLNALTAVQNFGESLITDVVKNVHTVVSDIDTVFSKIKGKL